MNDLPTARYFGQPWDVPAVAAATQCPTPVGRPCLWCQRRVRLGDRGWLRPYLRADHTAEIVPIHAECELAEIMGHSVGICPCTDWEPRSRATALAVWVRVFGYNGTDDGGPLGGGIACADPADTARIDPAAVRAARPGRWARLRSRLRRVVRR